MKPVSSYYGVSPILISTDTCRSSLSGNTLTICEPWKMAAPFTRDTVTESLPFGTILLPRNPSKEMLLKIPDFTKRLPIFTRYELFGLTFQEASAIPRLRIIPWTLLVSAVITNSNNFTVPGC